MKNDQPTSLGEYLRQERERRSITLEQLASATKISIKVLHSLESDHYRDLPAKPFIRGFVSSYCRFVGVDPQETLSHYDSFIDSRLSSDRPNRDGGHSGYAFEHKQGEQTKTVLWVIMGSFIAVGGIVFAVLKPNLHHHHHSGADKLKAIHGSPSPDVSPSLDPGAIVAASPGPSAGPSPQVTKSPVPAPATSTAPAVPVATAVPTAAPSPSPAPSPTSAPSPSPVASPTPSPSPTPSATPEKPDPLNSGVNLERSEIKFKAIFRALEDVWVRYQVDSRAFMKFRIRKGGTLVLRAKERIVFQSSAPENMTLSLNGKGAKPVSREKSLETRQNTATLFLPAEVAKTIQDPFPGERPLPTPTHSPDGAASEQPLGTP